MIKEVLLSTQSNDKTVLLSTQTNVKSGSFGSTVFVYVLLCILCLFKFCNHLEKEEKAGCLVIIVLQMHCYYKFSVTFAAGAVGWPAVCDCGIS